MPNEFELNLKQKSLQKQLDAKTKEKLQKGVAFHQKGLLRRAKRIYEEILKTQPKHFDSLHLLGVLAYQSADYQRSVNLINMAIRK